MKSYNVGNNYVLGNVIPRKHSHKFDIYMFGSWTFLEKFLLHS